MAFKAAFKAAQAKFTMMRIIALQAVEIRAISLSVRTKSNVVNNEKNSREKDEIAKRMCTENVELNCQFSWASLKRETKDIQS